VKPRELIPAICLIVLLALYGCQHEAPATAAAQVTGH
jgi:hypothetical protein